MKHDAFMILIVFSIAFFNQPYLGQIRDLSEHPDEIAMHVNVVNNGNDDAEDVRVSMFIYDLGIQAQSKMFDLDDHEKAAVVLRADTYAAEPGWYLARISLRDDIRELDVDHRYVEII